MLRVSTTTLESFRRLLQTDYGSQDALIASIQGRFTPTWQMRAGSVWQAILENPAKYLSTRFNPEDGQPFDVFEDEGFIFAAEAVRDALEHLGPGLAEVKATLTLNSRRPVTVVAKADHVHGLVVQDNKAKFGSIDPSAYDPDLQWRFYLLAHGAGRFRYNLFDFCPPNSHGFCVLHGIQSFSYWPYPALEAECQHWVNRFLDWAEDHNLLTYLERDGTL